MHRNMVKHTLFSLFVTAGISFSTTGFCSELNPGEVQAHNQESKTLTPEKFGEQFKSACEVGKRGGDGTLVSSNWVITAANVGRGMYRRGKGKFSVYFGDAQYRVKSVFVHPKSGPMSRYDIALLELEKPVVGYKPIPVFRDRDELGREIVIAGHGDKRDAHNEWIKDGKLRAYTNKIDSVNELRIVFDFDPPGQTRTFMEGTSGPGDSGGPALIEKGGKYYVAGISSMGEPGKNGPATYGAIEYFVRVSSFLDWIDQTMNHPDPKLALSEKDVADERQQGQARSIELPMQLGENAGKKDLSESAQAKTAKQFLDALQNFDQGKMETTIRQCFAKQKLARMGPATIIKNMPARFSQLRGAKLSKVIRENSEQIVVELEKENARFLLKIFFDKNESDKIRELAFGPRS